MTYIKKSPLRGAIFQVLDPNAQSRKKPLKTKKNAFSKIFLELFF
jgi:hypothetical protein